MPFVMSSILKLLVMPVELLRHRLFFRPVGLLLVQVMILLAAVATATSLILLARQLGGDAPLMAVSLAANPVGRFAIRCS